MNYEEIEKTRKETQQPREIHIRIAIEIFNDIGRAGTYISRVGQPPREVLLAE